MLTCKKNSFPCFLCLNGSILKNTDLQQNLKPTLQETACGSEGVAGVVHWESRHPSRDECSLHRRIRFGAPAMIVSGLT